MSGSGKVPVSRMKRKRKHYKIYIFARDGGYAWVQENTGKKFENHSSKVKPTTGMFEACLSAVEAVRKGAVVDIYTESASFIRQKRGKFCWDEEHDLWELVADLRNEICDRRLQVKCHLVSSEDNPARRFLNRNSGWDKPIPGLDL